MSLEVERLYKRKFSIEAREQFLLQLIDQYGFEVFQQIRADVSNIDVAKALWLDVFVHCMKQIRKRDMATMNIDFILKRLQPFLVDVNLRYSLPEPSNAHQSSLTDVSDGSVEISKEKNVHETPLALDMEEMYPVDLPIRGYKQIRAVAAEMEAMAKHTGPKWTGFSFLLMALFGILAVAYGLNFPWFHQDKTNIEGKNNSGTVNALPVPYGNLPVSTLAQYRLATNSPDFLQHIAIAQKQFMVASLVMHEDSWPRIDFTSIPLNSTGMLLNTQHMKVTHKLELIPPIEKTTVYTTKNSQSWSIRDWQVSTTGNWLIALVTWSKGDGNNPSQNVIQIYGFNLDSGQYSLMKSLSSVGSQAYLYTVSVGDERMVVQSEIQTKGNSATVVNLPMTVYILSGEDPLHALKVEKELDASFGFMLDPVVFKEGIVFQGILGQPSTNKNNADWYMLNWDGAVNKYIGPPLDGQPHWALQGTNGTLWWLETTPDPKVKGDLQVSMAPLSAMDKSSEPSITLGGPVSYVTVVENDVLWIQNRDSVRQLVIAQVQ